MLRTGSSSRPLRFLARESEIERLRRRFDAAANGRGGLIQVGGPARAGVTILAREAAWRAGEAGFAVMWGRGVEGTLGRPFSGLADALEDYGLSLAPNVLTADLAADAGPIIRLCPRLAPLVPTLTPSVPLDPADERLRLYEATVGWLRRASARQPLLVVIDNAELLDADVVALLAHVAKRIREMPLLILFAGFVPQLKRASLETIELGGLDLSATEALLEQVGSEPVSVGLAGRIHDAGGGLPLVSLDLLRHMALEGAERQKKLPGSLTEAIAWRVTRLTGEARLTLETVACFPDAAPTQLVAAALGISRNRAVMDLETAVDVGLIKAAADPGAYSFDQPSVRGAVMELAAPAGLAQLRRRLASAIEDQHRERLREWAGMLTHLYAGMASTDPRDRGVGHALLAAEQARAAYAHHRAVACLRIALALASERDRALRADLLGRVAVAEASAGLRSDALKTARALVDLIPTGAQVPADVHTGVTDTLRALRGNGLTEKELRPLEVLRQGIMARAGRADPLVRARLELLAEHWAPTTLAGITTLAWTNLQPEAARALLATRGETDGAEVLLAQRARTQSETAAAAEFARAWRRPQSVLRAMRALVTDLLTRNGLFREAAKWASDYQQTAERYGAHRHRGDALLLRARAIAVLGEFNAADEAIAAALEQISPLDDPSELSTEITLARLSLTHFRDDYWADFAAQPMPARKPNAAGLLLGAQRALAETRIGNEVQARAMLPPLLEATAQQPPLTLYRDAALIAALTAAWEMGAAEHAAAGLSLINLAQEAGVGGQIEGTLSHTRARMLALVGDLAAARDLFADERPALDRAGLRPLRAIVDHDEAIAIAAAGKDGYIEATRLLQSAATQFRLLGMQGWLTRTNELLANGLDAAAAPGGRLTFTYPRGLSRREADVIRLIAAGASNAEAAARLVLELATVERLLSSAMEKLEADRPEELPRLARRHGLATS